MRKPRDLFPLILWRGNIYVGPIYARMYNPICPKDARKIAKRLIEMADYVEWKRKQKR